MGDSGGERAGTDTEDSSDKDEPAPEYDMALVNVTLARTMRTADFPVRKDSTLASIWALAYHHLKSARAEGDCFWSVGTAVTDLSASLDFTLAAALHRALLPGYYFVIARDALQEEGADDSQDRQTGRILREYMKLLFVRMVRRHGS